MSSRSYSKIAELAERLGEQYLKNGGVDVYAMLEDHDITNSFEPYGSSFEGLLEYTEGNFHIYLNKDLLRVPHSPRTRFTIAHEIGHYSIESHKRKLMNGQSLSFQGQGSSIKPKTEREADFFASRFLMPQFKYIEVIQSSSLGLESVYKATKEFKTSLEASIIRYMNLNVSASLLIKLDSIFKVKYVMLTHPFYQKTGISRLPALKIDNQHLQNTLKLIKTSNGSHYEAITSLSSWVSTIAKGSVSDLVAIEQIASMGEYGSFVLLTVEY